MVLLVARWTYAFLLIHNLITFASYALKVLSRNPDWFTEETPNYIIATEALDEAALFAIMLSVPTSYLMGNYVVCT